MTRCRTRFGSRTGSLRQKLRLPLDCSVRLLRYRSTVRLPLLSSFALFVPLFEDEVVAADLNCQSVRYRSSGVRESLVDYVNAV